MSEIEHKGSKIKVNVAAEGITKSWQIDDPYHEVATELKSGAKRVHVASLFQAGEGPWQFHVADSHSANKPNSFRDLAVARAASGSFGNEQADEEEHSLVQAKQARLDKLKALAKSRGSTKRKKSLEF